MFMRISILRYLNDEGIYSWTQQVAHDSHMTQIENTSEVTGTASVNFVVI